MGEAKQPMILPHYVIFTTVLKPSLSFSSIQTNLPPSSPLWLRCAHLWHHQARIPPRHYLDQCRWDPRNFSRMRSPPTNSIRTIAVWAPPISDSQVDDVVMTTNDVIVVVVSVVDIVWWTNDVCPLIYCMPVL